MLFSDLLEQTYFEKIDTYLEKSENFSEKNIVYLKETIKGNYAVVGTKIITGNGSLEIPVHYRLKNTQCNWLVCDIAIEGVSIVVNYRTQFNEILANSSFKELLERLRSKQASAPADNGKK